MATIGGNRLLEDFGGALGVARRLLLGSLNSYEQQVAPEVVRRIHLEAARIQLEWEGAGRATLLAVPRNMVEGGSPLADEDSDEVWVALFGDLAAWGESPADAMAWFRRAWCEGGKDPEVRARLLRGAALGEAQHQAAPIEWRDAPSWKRRPIESKGCPTALPVERPPKTYPERGEQ